MTAMLEEAQEPTPDFIELAAEIVSAYVANNSVPIAEVSVLIGNVHKALNDLAAGSAPVAVAAEVQKAPPAQIRKSITPDALISFIDGKPYKTLKRHLTGHGLDPYTYRERYGLPKEYPMVAASYAAQRSELAKALGLGRLGAHAQTEQPTGRGRRKAG
jgi:predicted transcriptional regulator